MAIVVVDGDAQEGGDIEDAVDGVRPVARPAGLVKRADRRDRRGSDGRERGQDRVDRGIVEAWREAGFRPCPVRIVLGGDLGEASLKDLGVDRDQVAGDLGGAPRPIGKRATGREPRG
jgi:hypothetical protein